MTFCWTKAILLILLMAMQSFAYGIGSPLIRNFSTSQSGISSENRAIIQDSTGRLFVGNSQGINIYDGESWTTIPLPNHSKVRSLSVGPENIIYVGGQEEYGRIQFINGHYIYESLTHHTPKKYNEIGDIWNIHIVEQTVVFQSTQILITYEKDTFNYLNPENAIHFASHLVENGVYCSDQFLGLRLFKNGSLQNSDLGTSITEPLYCLLPYRPNELLFYGLENGLGILNKNTGNISYPKFNNTLDHFKVYDAVILKNGNFAFASKSEGLIITNNRLELIYHFHEDNGLLSNAINTLFEDINGNLWLGEEKGIDFIAISSPFSGISKNEGISGIVYNIENFDDSLFIATSQGLYKQALNTSARMINANPKSIWNDAWFVKNIQNTLLFGNNIGTFQYNKGVITPILTDGNGGWDAQILLGHPHLLLIGTYNGAYIAESKNGKWQIRNKIVGYDGPFRLFAQDRSASIWLSNPNKGIYHFKLNENFTAFEKLIKFDSSDELDPPYPITAYKGRIISSSKGILCTLSDQKGTLSKAPFLSGNTKSEHHSLHVIGDSLYSLMNKIVKLYDLKKQPALLIKEISTPYRFTPNFESLTVLPSGELILGTLNGALLFNNQKTISDFSVLVSKATLSNTTGEIVNINNKPNKFEINSKMNRLHVQFGSNYFQSEPIFYSYRLVGYDSNWSTFNTNSQINLTNLMPGDYQLEIICRNAAGQISPSSTLSFVILKPWHQSTLALVIYAIAFFGLLALLYLLLNYQSKKKYLKSIQEQRRKLLDERIKNQKERLDLKNKQLATQALQLHENQEVLSQVERKLDKVYHGGESKTVTIKSVQELISTKLDGQSSWKEFESLFSNVHDNFFNALKDAHPNLNTNELRMCGFIKLNMTNKEISTILNLSVRGFETARYRLKKRLDLPADQNLTTYIQGI